MRDRTIKVLLFLIFLALVLNAFVMLARPSVADDGQVGRYAIAAYGFHDANERTNHFGYLKMDTVTGDVKRGTVYPY